ncbi:Protein kinase superfamily protein [Perilla frutescens var. hirtella]|uniref:Protein kinase superfamily protein n=1 Tax=Perilla frutescens var. hirtella TaxID=608512 RepID=A0AAD4JHR3_PERFH|nr:Protein kinase superfamily protein [Perilla frutescens var. hirtella]
MFSEDEGKLYFIDFEYGLYNYRGFNLRNHFNEYVGYNCDYNQSHVALSRTIHPKPELARIAEDCRGAWKHKAEETLVGCYYHSPDEPDGRAKSVVVRKVPLKASVGMRRRKKMVALVWSDMAMIALSPHLQILKLENVAVVGHEWNFSAKEEFICLKHLEIKDYFNLRKWSADSSSFPVLEILSLSLLYNLKEISSGIGEIPTLERIDIEYCIESVYMLAIKILEEQESFGNQSLQLNFNNESDVEMKRRKIQRLGITC